MQRSSDVKLCYRVIAIMGLLLGAPFEAAAPVKLLLALARAAQVPGKP